MTNDSIGIIHGDCLQVMKHIPENSIDLVVTSPPYANSRSMSYGGSHPDVYVEWFMPITVEIYRVLKTKGTFILNIKEKVVSGERHTYVLNAIIEMRKMGWLWTEEFIWHKKNCVPGKWPNRFRDSWERCLQFNKDKKFSMYQEEVMVPVGDWAEKRLKNLGLRDNKRRESRVGSGFGFKMSNFVGRDMVYPTNVLSLPTESYNRGHSAVFPVSLPLWFVKLFTIKGDVVLDPFMGSGTTGVACKQLKRRFIGIEKKGDYCCVAEKRIGDFSFDEEGG